MQKLILTDVDECILQWTDPFIRFVNEKYNVYPKAGRNSHLIYEWLEVHPDKAYEMVIDFNTSHHFGALEPFNSAAKYIPMLHNEGYRFVAISACSDSDHVAEMRKANIAKYFGNIFEDIFCVGFHQGKKSVLEKFPKSFWVEDAMQWALVGADAGHQTFLIDHEHNKLLIDPRIIRVKDWHTIYNLVRSYNEDDNIPEGLQIVTEKE